MIQEKVFHLLSFLSLASAANILLLPGDRDSSMTSFTSMGNTLLTRGHRVIILANENGESTDAKLVHPEGNELLFKDKSYNDTRKPAPHCVPMIPKVIRKYVDWCEHVLRDNKLMKQLGDEQFDLVIVDGFLKNRCLYAIPYKLGIKYMTLTDTPDPWNLRVGSLPSVEPVGRINASNEMPFLTRLYNLVVFLKLGSVLPRLVDNDNIVERLVAEKPPKSLMELYKGSEMFLVNVETFILDYPRVSAPHYQFIGGLGCSPANALSAKLNRYLNKADNGVVIVSFGSFIKQMPLTTMNKIIHAFAKLSKLRFVMISDVQIPEKLPDNLMLVEDTPLHDILNHNKVRALVTSGDNRDQNVAMCHGIPQVIIPLYGEQYYNAERSRSRKYGVVVEITDLNPDDLISGINEVVDKKQYSENAQRASKLIRSLPDVKSTFVYWVEHILVFGGDHLRPPFMDMPLYEFLMIDIVLFILAIFHITVYIIYRLILVCYRIFKRLSKEKLS